jgi:hypothetical protein
LWDCLPLNAIWYKQTKPENKVNKMNNNPNNIPRDTSLVNCAEYQLFLDDLSAQGNYYHPWHWTSHTFQAGHGDEPILGIQPSDIQAFCAWLNTHANGLWHYRLPHKDELPQILAHLEQTGQSQPIGFWAEENNFAWLNGVAPEYENLQEMALDQLALDRAQALAYDRVHTTYDLRDAINGILTLERKLNDQQAPDISPLLVQDCRIHPLDFGIYDYRFLASDFIHYLDSLKNAMLKNRFSGPIDSKTHELLSHKQETKQLYWLIRYWSQLRARHYYSELSQINKPQKRQRHAKRQNSQEKSPAALFALYKRICIDFTLLELRTQGKLPPWEGILLVP